MRPAPTSATSIRFTMTPGAPMEWNLYSISFSNRMTGPSPARNIPTCNIRYPRSGPMADKNKTPTTAEELRAAILARYETLSKRLQQIARYVWDEPNAVALETLAVLAERTGVQPSAIVRFAKSFGFEGATQMQRLFRDGLLSANASLGYGERVREFAK